MNKKDFGPIWKATIVLVLASLACSSTQAATPTAVPTNTSVPPTATATLIPTSTPMPTATPNIAATKQVEADQAILQKYVDNGYLPSTDGTLYSLRSSTFNMAQQNYLDFEDSGATVPVTDFAAWADISWSSAGIVNSPEYSGCGFAFRFQDNGDGYTAMLTNDSVLITWCFAGLGNRCGRVGKTKGTGRVSLKDPAKAHFEFVVSNGLAYALVNGDLIGEYTLFDDKLTKPGNFYYTLISGTNKDYGTRCTVENAKLWVPNQ